MLPESWCRTNSHSGDDKNTLLIVEETGTNFFPRSSLYVESNSKSMSKSTTFFDNSLPEPCGKNLQFLSVLCHCAASNGDPLGIQAFVNFLIGERSG